MRPLSPTERRETPLSYGEERNAFGYATARGPWPDLRAAAPQPARGPTMWPILWLCWPMLVYLAGNVGPSCGYVGLCWPQVDSC